MSLRPKPFWERIKQTETCWLWTGYILRSGYGAIHTKAYSGTLAHRVAWELANGPIPEGMNVLHRCDVRHCVRPEHLFLGTLKDNAQDAWGKGRGKVPNNNGERQGNAKLTWADVRLIRQSTESHSVLAHRFNVTAHNIYQIRRGRSWKESDAQI